MSITTRAQPLVLSQSPRNNSNEDPNKRIELMKRKFILLFLVFIISIYSFVSNNYSSLVNYSYHNFETKEIIAKTGNKNGNDSFVANNHSSLVNYSYHNFETKEIIRNKNGNDTFGIKIINNHSNMAVSNSRLGDNGTADNSNEEESSLSVVAAKEKTMRIISILDDNSSTSIHSNNSHTHSNNEEKEEVKEVVVGEPPQVCALFSVWGNVPKYTNEVRNTMGRLRALNPQIYIILATDNPSINNNNNNHLLLANSTNTSSSTTASSSDAADYVYELPSDLKNLTDKGWLVRVLLIGRMSTIIAPQCDVTISLDSHVTICSSNLYQRLVDFWANARKSGKHRNNYDTKPDGPVLATDIEHAPMKQYYSSVIHFWKKQKARRWNVKEIPYCFGIIWVKSKEMDELTKVWHEKMLQTRLKDDQIPLRLAMDKVKFRYFTRIASNFLMGFKAYDKSRKGKPEFPRFTYLLPQGEVSLIHSYKINASFPGKGNDFSNNKIGYDFCEFLNSDLRPRFPFLEHENGNYSLITRLQECQKRLAPYDKRICDDVGFLNGNNWTTSG